MDIYEKFKAQSEQAIEMLQMHIATSKFIREKNEKNIRYINKKKIDTNIKPKGSSMDEVRKMYHGSK